MLQQVENQELQEEILSPIVLMEIVVKYFSERFPITIYDLLSKCRKDEFVRARQMWSALVRHKDQHIPLQTMGRLLGGRDHSTIIHSLVQFNDKYDVEHEFRIDYQAILKTAYPNETDNVKPDLRKKRVYVRKRKMICTRKRIKIICPKKVPTYRRSLYI